MAKGTLGKRILAGSKHEDIEVQDGIKVRVRPMNALHLFAFRQAAAGHDAGKLSGDELFDFIYEKDPQFLPKLIAECCFDPETGDAAFEPADAAQLPREVFTALIVGILQLSRTPEAEDLKAESSRGASIS